MVDAVNPYAAQGRIGAGSQMLASNFETFLSLLTAQLKNQDPLSPVDSNQFTAQLTQMAGVEQQLLTNDLLTSLLAQGSSGTLTGASQYIGKEATAVWSAMRLEGGQATWSYELASEAKSATLAIVDGQGNTVWSGEAPDLEAGVHDFTWDGKTTLGGQLEDGGVYTLKVTAKDAAGETIDSQVLVRGQVTGVELYNGEPYLTLGASILPLSSVIALNQMGAGAEPDPEADPEAQGLMARVASALNPMNLF